MLKLDLQHFPTKAELFGLNWTWTFTCIVVVVSCIGCRNHPMPTLNCPQLDAELYPNSELCIHWIMETNKNRISNVLISLDLPNQDTSSSQIDLKECSFSFLNNQFKIDLMNLTFKGSKLSSAQLSLHSQSRLINEIRDKEIWISSINSSKGIKLKKSINQSNKELQYLSEFRYQESSKNAFNANFSLIFSWQIEKKSNGWDIVPQAKNSPRYYQNVSSIINSWFKARNLWIDSVKFNATLFAP